MKKKIFLMLILVFILACLFAVSVSAEVTVYDDAPKKTIISVSTDDIVVFDDGFSCPSAYIFKDQKLLAMDFSYINGKVQKTYTIENVIELDIPEGIDEIYQYQFTKNTTMIKCSIPASVTKLQQCIFQQASGLQELVFEHTEESKLDHFPNWMVYGCTSLRAFSMPDCITMMTGVAQFNSCTSLTALYLSKNLVSIGSGSGNTASFGFCPNLFFVNEPFTYDNVPTQKPTVYYFPNNLTSLPSGGEVFKNCTSLNDVLVFPKGVTEIANGWAFCNSNAISVVFLGNMEKVSTTGNAWNKNITIYFCNENDLSSENVNMTTNAKKVYCHAEGNTEHLFEKTVSTDATCTEAAKVTSYCFCGANMGTEYDEANPAKGHSNVTTNIAYVNYLDTGVRHLLCTVCNTESTEDVEALIENLGYSVGINSIVQGFKVNGVMSEYKTYHSVSFGVVASTVNTPLAYENGSVVACNSNVIFASQDKLPFKYFDIKVVSIPDAHVDTSVVLCAYAVIDEELYYLSNGETTNASDGVLGTTYSSHVE